MTEADCAPEPNRGFFRVQSVVGQAGAVSGRVLDANRADSPVTALADGRIRIAGQAVPTDSLGQFAIRLPAGRYALQTLRIGYQSRTDSITLDGANSVTLAIGLVPEVYDGCPGFMAIVTRERKWRWW